MRSTLTLWPILSFTAIAVFGFLAMSENMTDHNKGCLAATAAGAICPSENIFNMAFFHTNVFKSFSLAIIFAIILILGILVFEFKIYDILRYREIGFEIADNDAPTIIKKMRAYLALHENSPEI